MCRHRYKFSEPSLYLNRGIRESDIRFKPSFLLSLGVSRRLVYEVRFAVSVAMVL